MSSYSEHSCSSCDSDAESVSSSVLYVEQEPFVTFRNRVLDLALHKIWPDATADEITIERMIGGGFNRIIGLSRHTAQQPDNDIRYILRIPRDADQPLDSQVGTLRFLHERCNIPAPKVISFDHTDNNELNSRYMIQNRIPGETLLSSYPNLTHEERCRVARELGHVYSELLATKSATSTILVPPEEEDIRDPPIPQDIRKMLFDIFEGQKAAELEARPDSIIRPELLDQFCEMTSDLAEEGWFEDCQISLAHLDMEPRNILVNPTSDTELPIISAVLDWDSAIFAPQFMCCTPPLWLWAWSDYEEEDERTANDMPPTREGRQLKQLFEQAAGPRYIRLAYLPVYRFARQLVRFAVQGLLSNEDYNEAREMLREWEDFFYETCSDESSNNSDSEEDENSDAENEGTAEQDGTIITKAAEIYTTIQDYSTTTWSAEDATIRQDESTTAWQ
ncbi:kinase-like domain-containing protein [Daldinia loculata]|nr:kinase-like domain-containing protein [Daldinia loculata]